MGNDIGSGPVTDCFLRLFSDLKRQTELHYVGWAKNKNKRNPNQCHHPLIIQLNKDDKQKYNLYFQLKDILFIIKQEKSNFFNQFLVNKRVEILALYLIGGPDGAWVAGAPHVTAGLAFVL